MSANYAAASKSRASMSSDDEMYDGLGGRSKPDIYPEPRMKPLIKKRKLVANFKKKIPPPSGTNTLDKFLSSEML